MGFLDILFGRKKDDTFAGYKPSKDPDEKDCRGSERIIRERIEMIARDEWAGYELRQNISPFEIGCIDEAREFTYGLYSENKPVAMIIVLKKPHQYRNTDVVASHQACEAKGIFCMNLLPHMPNRRSYISARLRENIKIN